MSQIGAEAARDGEMKMQAVKYEYRRTAVLGLSDDYANRCHRHPVLKSISAFGKVQTRLPTECW